MGASYVSALARLDTATQQDHVCLIPNRVVNTVPLPNMNTHFADAPANRSTVAQIAFFDTINTNEYSCLRAPITQSLQPTMEGRAFDNLVSLVGIVSQRRQSVKKYRRLPNLTRKLERFFTSV